MFGLTADGLSRTQPSRGLRTLLRALVLILAVCHSVSCDRGAQKATTPADPDSAVQVDSNSAVEGRSMPPHAEHPERNEKSETEDSGGPLTPLEKRLRSGRFAVKQIERELLALMQSGEVSEVQLLSFVLAMHEQGLLVEPDITGVLGASLVRGYVTNPENLVDLAGLIDSANMKKMLLLRAVRQSSPPDFELFERMMLSTTNEEVRRDLVRELGLAFETANTQEISEAVRWIDQIAFDDSDKSTLADTLVSAVLDKVDPASSEFNVAEVLELVKLCSPEHAHRPLAVVAEHYVRGSQDLAAIQALADVYKINTGPIVSRVALSINNLDADQAEGLLGLLPSERVYRRVGVVAITDGLIAEYGHETAELQRALNIVTDPLDQREVVARFGIAQGNLESVERLLAFGNTVEPELRHVFFGAASQAWEISRGTGPELNRIHDALEASSRGSEAN